ncbi:MAG: ABC transporter permease [Hyphomicrobiales bacterium]|nr:ABC transporter permease [Hyphomicrobiales bacterium]MDE2115949.1 ABC transporter permease [Hyphomicrobiales bacterium]
MTVRNAMTFPWRRTQRFWGDLYQSLQVQSRVIAALMIREAMSRFGHENIGFFWIIVEPMLFTIGVMLMWTLAGTEHTGSIGIPAFALTGYSIVTLWRHIVGQATVAMRSGVGLIYHLNVKMLDILIARSLLEVIAVFASFSITYIPFFLLGYIPWIRDPLVLVGGYFLTAWFAFSFGLILAALAAMNEAVERIMNPLMYITIPVLGVFYMVSWLPPLAQAVVLWSPMVNVSEMFRSGLFPADIETHWDASYVAIVSLIQTAVGLYLIKIAQKQLRME